MFFHAARVCYFLHKAASQKAGYPATLTACLLLFGLELVWGMGNKQNQVIWGSLKQNEGLHCCYSQRCSCLNLHTKRRVPYSSCSIDSSLPANLLIMFFPNKLTDGAANAFHFISHLWSIFLGQYLFMSPVKTIWRHSTELFLFRDVCLKQLIAALISACWFLCKLSSSQLITLD